MEFEQSSVCALHGAGVAPPSLIGRRFVKLTASWFWHDNGQYPDPLEVWLTDEHEESIRITTGSDWCLIVDASEPHESYDMGEWGRVEVRESCRETPFAEHIGDPVVGASEDYEPFTGRIALDLTFPTGLVRCESWSGDLRLKRAS